jgi:hypothetical protein
MATLSELISRHITPEAKGDHKPSVQILSAPIDAKSEKPQDQYEAKVFNFLLAKPNKEELGIKQVRKFTALLVDGAVELMLAVEIKLCMNWLKACQAEWQFRGFLKRIDRRPFPVDGGIVFFEEFSGDWKRQAGGRLFENGWSHWYRGHSEVEGFRLDLLRLRGGKLDAFQIVPGQAYCAGELDRSDSEEALKN